MIIFTNDCFIPLWGEGLVIMNVAILTSR